MRGIGVLIGLTLVGCVAAPLTIMVSPTGETFVCHERGIGLGGAAMAQEAHANCVKQLKALGWMTAEEYQTLRERGGGQAPILVDPPTVLREYWASLREKVEQNELTAREAVERFNAKELTYYKPSPALDEIQAFRRYLAELVDQGKVSVIQADLAEARYRRWVLQTARSTDYLRPLTDEERQKFWMTFIEGGTQSPQRFH